MPPEDLPKFYAAIVSGKGEFINGSRLVYPMEKRAMRFLESGSEQVLRGCFFLCARTALQGHALRYQGHFARELSTAGEATASYFGEFDPFGDFDLIFGAARMGLRIVEIPITYRERTYGETNISRWRHGALLIAMLVFAARRLKFI